MILSLLPFSSLSHPSGSCKMLRQNFEPTAIWSCPCSDTQSISSSLSSVFHWPPASDYRLWAYWIKLAKNLWEWKLKIKGKAVFKKKKKLATITSCPLPRFFPRCLTHGESQISPRPESSVEAEKRAKKLGNQNLTAAVMRQLQAGSTESMAWRV